MASAYAQQEGALIRAVVDIQAPVERIWRAISEPDHLARWWAERAAGYAEPAGEITLNFDDLGFELTQHVSRMQAPHTLALEFEGSSGAETIHFEVERSPVGAKLILLHRRSVAAQCPELISGWQLALGHLAYYCENHFGDPSLSLIEIAESDFAKLHDALDWFTLPGRLQEWLGSPSERIREDEELVLCLADGVRASGRVLAVTSHEVLLEWKEENALLTLKAFPSEYGIAVGVAIRVWGNASEQLLRAFARRSTERLQEAIASVTS